MFARATVCVRVIVVQPGAVDTELTDLIRPSKQPL